MKKKNKQAFSLIILVIFVLSSLTFALLNVTPEQEEEQIWVSRISIVISEELQIIPSGVGVNGDNRDILYTLEEDNIIYKNTDQPVKLKDFFNIWGESFNSTCILDNCNEGNKTMKMFVNNIINTDYELYTINDKDDIVIDYR